MLTAYLSFLLCERQERAARHFTSDVMFGVQSVSTSTTFNKYGLFSIQVNVHRDKFLQQNQLDALISQIYFCNKTLHVSDSSSVYHQEFFTVHTATVCQQTCMTYTIAVCTVKNS